MVADPELVNTFITQAKGPAWLRWAATHHGAKFFAPAAHLGEAEKKMAGWFVRQFNEDEEAAAEAVRLLVENGGRLNEYLWLNMLMKPDVRGGASREAANRMLLVLADAVPADADLARCALRLLDECDAPQDDELFLELVDRVFAPRLAPANSTRVCNWPGGAVPCRRATTPRTTGCPAAPTRSSGRAAATSPPICSASSTVTSAGSAASTTSPATPTSFERRAAVEDHEWNTVERHKHFFVDSARHLHEVLAEDQPVTAAGYLCSWEASRWAVQNRLAIHGWANRTDSSVDQKIGWLLQHDRWVSDSKLHHEAMLLISKAAPEASEGTPSARSYEQITRDTELGDVQVEFDRLGWIAQHASDSARARQALQQAQTASQAELEMSEHPDFPRTFQTGLIVTANQYLDGLGPQDLIELLSSDRPGRRAAHRRRRPGWPRQADDDQLVLRIAQCPKGGTAVAPSGVRIAGSARRATRSEPGITRRCRLLRPTRPWRKQDRP